MKWLVESINVAGAGGLSVSLPCWTKGKCVINARTCWFNYGVIIE